MANTAHRSQIGLDGQYLLSQKWMCAQRQQLSVSRYNCLTHFTISESAKLLYKKCILPNLVVYCGGERRQHGAPAAQPGLVWDGCHCHRWGPGLWCEARRPGRCQSKLLHQGEKEGLIFRGAGSPPSGSTSFSAGSVEKAGDHGEQPASCRLPGLVPEMSLTHCCHRWVRQQLRADGSEPLDYFIP